MELAEIHKILKDLQPSDRERVHNSVTLFLRFGLGCARPADVAPLLQDEQPDDSHVLNVSTRSLQITDASVGKAHSEPPDIPQITKTKEAADLLLNACLQITSGSGDIGEVIEGLIRNAAALLGAERCSLFRVEDNELVSSGPGKEGPDTIRVPVGTGICGHVALKGQFVNIPDAYADSRFNQENDRRTGFRTRSLLCCPVFFNGNVIAVVQFINKMHGDEHIPFAENDESLFTVFSSFAGVALSNAYHRNDAACERKKKTNFYWRQLGNLVSLMHKMKAFTQHQRLSCIPPSSL